MTVSTRIALCLTLFFARATWAEPAADDTADAGVIGAGDPAAPPLDAGVVTPEVTPTPAAAEPAPAAPEPAPAPAGRSAHHAFRVWAGGGLLGRDLNLSDASLGRNRQPAGGAVNVGVSAFPGAAFTDNALAHLGAFLTADFGVGLRSRGTSTGGRYEQSGSRLRFGVQWRVVATEALAIVVHGGWSRFQLETASTNADGTARPLPPNMLLNGLRGGVSVQWHLWERLSAELNASGQSVLELGALGAAASDAAGGALDAGVVVAVELLAHLSARVSFEWQRYFFSFSRGGGYDNSLWLNVGLMWSM